MASRAGAGPAGRLGLLGGRGDGILSPAGQGQLPPRAKEDLEHLAEDTPTSLSKA